MTDTAMTSQEVLDAIARERARLMASVDALRDNATTLAVTEEGWTAKDVLGHCIHWASLIAFGLGAQLEPAGYVSEERQRRASAGIGRLTDGNEWNALAVAYYRNRALNEVRAELEATIDAIVERAGERSDEQMNATDAIPWAPGQALWALIGAETFLHWPSHSEAIEKAAAGEGR